MARLVKFELAMFAYSDHLAMARKFVTAATEAGIKVTHVRPASKAKGKALQSIR